MIVVRIELWPKGREVNVRELGCVFIRNTGRGSDARADYDVELVRSPDDYRVSPYRAGHVRGFPRKSLPAYDLLLRALLACVGHRNRRAIERALDAMQPRRACS